MRVNPEFTSPSIPIQDFSRNQIQIPKPEYRMSNKEVRMMKSKDLDWFLRRSLFVVRPARYARKRIWYRYSVPTSDTATVALRSTSQGRRAFCGSFLKSSVSFEQVADCDSIYDFRQAAFGTGSFCSSRAKFFSTRIFRLVCS